ncbi:MAG: GspH/FimT family protein [Gemmatimonadota bacterium]
MTRLEREVSTDTIRLLRAVGGFSLVEMTVVLLILGLSAMMTLPRLDTARYRLDAAVREVHSVLLRAQRQAVLFQHDVVVRFDVENGVLIVHADRNNDGEIQGDEPNVAVSLPDEARFGRRDVVPLAFGPEPVSFADAEVTFRRDGSASAEGGLYLSSVRQLAAGSHPSETRALQVVRATGSARCVSFRGSAWTEEC